MQGKTILITGGNAGIGKSTAEGLVKLGAHVIITSRDLEKGEQALQEIKHSVPDAKIDLFSCDLASFASIHHLAGKVRQKFNRLDVLINNAGLFSSHFQQTREGFEMQFGVNHLGHFLLTKLLMDMLKAAPNPRVINVSSSAHFKGDIDFSSFKQVSAHYNGFKAYAQSKLANILFTKELARRFANLDCNCLHPGVVRTGIGTKNANLTMSLIWRLWQPFMCTPEKGARTSIYLASAPEVEGVSGKYFHHNQKPCVPARLARSPALAQKLWDISENFVV